MRALVVMVVALALAEPVAAAPHVPAYSALSGPRLMGDEVMWVQSGINGSARIVTSTRAAAPARLLARLPYSDPGMPVGYAALSTSASGWAVSYGVYVAGHYESPHVATEVLAAIPGGPIRRVVRCEFAGESNDLAGAWLTGTALFTVIDPCAGVPGDIEVRSLPGDGPVERRLDGGRLWQAAGDLLATIEDDRDRRTLVIRDWRRDVELRRLDFGRFRWTGLMIAPDGSIFGAYPLRETRLNRGQRVAVAPPDGSFRDLPLARADQYHGLRLVEGRLAFARTRDDRGWEVGLHELATGRTTIIASGPQITPSLDFDGERLVVSQLDCRGEFFRFTTDLERRMSVPAPPKCTRVRVSHVRPVGDGRVRFRYRCSGFTFGDPECLGRITLRTRDGRLLGRQRAATYLAWKFPGVNGGNVRLNAMGRRLLRRTGRLEAVVIVRTRDILDRTERRTGRLVLRLERE